MLNYLVTYVVIAVLKFVYIRYYALRKEIPLSQDPEWRMKYPTLVRSDYDQLHIIWSFPYYILAPFKIAVGVIVCILFGFYCILCSTVFTKESTKDMMMEKPLKYFSRFGMLQCGIKNFDYQK